MEGTPLAYLKTNYLEPEALLPVIFGAMGVSMPAMFGLIYIGAPVWLTVGALLGLMYLFVYSFIYNGEFWIHADKLEMKLTPKLRLLPFRKPSHGFYNWADLESYLIDSEMTRYSGERKYLKLFFINPKRKVAINEGTDDATKQQFLVFVEKFTSLLANNAATQQPEAAAPVTPETVVTPAAVPIVTERPVNHPPIQARARQSFYNSWGAKILAVVFMAATAVFLAMYFFPSSFGIKGMSGSASNKLWVVLVPGTLYFMARAFGRKNKKQP